MGEELDEGPLHSRSPWTERKEMREDRFENEIDLNLGLKREMREDSGWTDKMLFGGGHRTVYNLF
jgi:hypothetical protein